MININRNNSLEEQQLTEPGYYILLALLVPMHGYGVTKYIEELTDGEMVIGPATLYTMLKKNASSILYNFSWRRWKKENI